MRTLCPGAHFSLYFAVTIYRKKKWNARNRSPSVLEAEWNQWVSCLFSGSASCYKGVRGNWKLLQKFRIIRLGHRYIALPTVWFMQWTFMKHLLSTWHCIVEWKNMSRSELTSSKIEVSLQIPRILTQNFGEVNCISYSARLRWTSKHFIFWNVFLTVMFYFQNSCMTVSFSFLHESTPSIKAQISTSL